MPDVSLEASQARLCELLEERIVAGERTVVTVQLDQGVDLEVVPVVAFEELDAVDLVAPRVIEAVADAEVGDRGGGIEEAGDQEDGDDAGNDPAQPAERQAPGPGLVRFLLFAGSGRRVPDTCDRAVGVAVGGVRVGIGCGRRGARDRVSTVAAGAPSPAVARRASSAVRCASSALRRACSSERSWAAASAS